MGFIKKVSVVLAIFAMVGVANAQGKLRIGMQTWADWTQDMTDPGAVMKDEVSGFSVTRALVYLNYFYSDNWSVHGAFDFGSESPVDNLFHGYIQGKMGSLKMQIGRYNSWYVNELDKAMGTRWIMASLAEDNAIGRANDGIVVGGMLGSTIHWDLGINNGPNNLGVVGIPGERSYDIDFHVGASFSDSFGAHLVLRNSTEGLTTEDTMTYGGAINFNHAMFDMLAEIYLSEDDMAADSVMAWAVTANLKFNEGNAGFFVNYSMNDTDATVSSNHIVNNNAESFLKVGPWFKSAENGYKIGLFYNMAAANDAAFEDASYVNASFAAKF